MTTDTGAMPLSAKIYVAGHRGLVGSALMRALASAGYVNLITADRSELNLLNEAAVRSFFAQNAPEHVFLAAARVGGIRANNELPAEFIYQNLQIQTNVIHASHVFGVKKLLFLGSSCIYPNTYSGAIDEEQLLKGGLEPTNEWYAIAKIAGIKMCQAYRKQYGSNFISVMPTNLYGPCDNYDPFSSHVLPAFIHRFHQAKVNSVPTVECWGDGTSRREFLHSDDLARACVMLMQRYSSGQIINVGSSTDLTIRELAVLVADAVGYTGNIAWDGNPARNGTKRKLINSNRIRALGWKPTIRLEEGLKTTYEAFIRENGL